MMGSMKVFRVYNYYSTRGGVSIRLEIFFFFFFFVPGGMLTITFLICTQ